MSQVVVVAGIRGKMGRALLAESHQFPQFEIIGFDKGESIPTGKIDLWIDFSTKEAVGNHLAHCVTQKIPFLTGVTGFTQKEEASIKSYSMMLPLFLDYNMSIGINAIEQVLKKLKRMLPGYDIELIETHHNQKRDAPSGTAKKLLSVLNNNQTEKEIYGRFGIQPRSQKEIGIHSIRLGGVVGEHTVRFGNHLEEVFIGHRAYQRATFALGVLKAASWLIHQPVGFYNMDSYLKDVLSES